MLYNSLLFNKIESSIGVDKWVKVLDIQKKTLMKPLVLLTEFSVLIILIQFLGIYLYTMINSAIQLDLNLNFSRMNLLDNVFVASKISLTYIKSLLSNFQKQ
jgi:hypothetical protein